MTATTSNVETSNEANEQAEVVTGIIKGDRVCISCGFNLCGQRIVRESKYNLLIARCPECGQAAALQEYPLLGRWANRWASTLAGAWLMLFLLLSIGCGMTIFGLAVGTTEVNTDVLQREITGMHHQWQLSIDPNAQPNMYWGSIDEDWWDTVDQGALFQDTGGVSGIIWRSSQTTWIGLLFSMVVFGSFVSIALLGVSRSRLALAALFPLVISIMASVLYVRANIAYSTWSHLGAHDLGILLVWQWTIPMTIVLGGAFLITGMFIGRPLARLLARTVLPNRFVQALAVLWTSEGKEPPRPLR